MEYIKINSSQNVSIEFRLANILERIVAFFIDIIILCVYIYILFVFIIPVFWGTNIGSFFKKISYSEHFMALAMIVFFVVFMMPIFFYSFLFEFFMNGQTPGKIVMKIKAIKIDGFQMSFLDYFIRWLFRLIDIYSLYGIVAVISILVSKKGQRIGEIASGSATVSIKRDTKINDTIFTELQLNYKPTFSQVIMLTDNDMRIIKENFLIALKNKDLYVINKLANKILSVLEISNPFSTDEELISVIIKDYNYYTQFN